MGVGRRVRSLQRLQRRPQMASVLKMNPGAASQTASGIVAADVRRRNCAVSRIASPHVGGYAHSRFLNRLTIWCAMILFSLPGLSAVAQTNAPPRAKLKVT